MFVKGHLSFELDGEKLEFPHHDVSVFGATGLAWGPLDPRRHFGRRTVVSVVVPAAAGGKESLAFQAPARLMREFTAHFGHLGLKFELEPAIRARFSEHIARHGFYPTVYLRKYPRIPSMAKIPTFPLRVLVRPSDGQGVAIDQFPAVFDVGNLSPNGILISTENQTSLSFEPEHRVDLTFDPRGWFPKQIHVQGVICRVSDDLNPLNGNLVRYLGVKFTRVDDANRSAFLELLRDILEQLKKSAISS